MTPFRRIAAYAPPGVAMLVLGLASAVFQSRPGLTPPFEFTVCADEPGPLSTDLGVPVHVEHGLDALPKADLVLVLGGSVAPIPASRRVLDALRTAHRRGATVAGHCLGVFPLAATGLLDGIEVTTHWQFAGDLAARHPEVVVRPEPLYIDRGNLVTGAGAAAGMDMYLHLLRRDYGAALTNALARLLVTPPHRDGGQQQFITAVPVGEASEGLSSVIAWARENLHRPLTIDALATRAMMSKRSFIRHFKATTGTTPHAWLLTQRLSAAEHLLETTDLAVEQIASRVGYRSAAVLREQFMLRRGLAPRDYRRTFTHHRSTVHAAELPASACGHCHDR